MIETTTAREGAVRNGYEPARMPGKQQLLAAFAAAERLPALRHTRDRVLALVEDPSATLRDIARAVEMDGVISLVVLREAAAISPSGRSTSTDVVHAIDSLPRGILIKVLREMPVYDFFERSDALAAAAGRLRGHGLAVQRAALDICNMTDRPASSAVMVAALVHDIGKIVLTYAYDGYARLLDLPAEPAERLRYEISTFGIDHAVVGATCLRRMGLAADLLTAVADHHSPEATDSAAVIRLADMIAHYEAGRAVAPREIISTAVKLELRAEDVRELLALDRPDSPSRPRNPEPCPMSARQLEILRLLRAGMVYKQIAGELGLSVSTVRSHAHAIFVKLSVVDRTQAVLAAADRGWI